MTKLRKITTVVSIISLSAVFLAAPVFAKGETYKVTTSVNASNADYLAIEVLPPAEALAFFVAHGANENTIGLQSKDIPILDRNKIRAIYSNKDDPDYQSQVSAIVYAALGKYLEKGKVETVTTSIGPVVWKATLNDGTWFEDGSEITD